MLYVTASHTVSTTIGWSGSPEDPHAKDKHNSACTDWKIMPLPWSCSISEVTRSIHFTREFFNLTVAGFELLFIAADQEEFAACYSQKWSNGSVVCMRKSNVNKRNQHAKRKLFGYRARKIFSVILATVEVNGKFSSPKWQ